MSDYPRPYKGQPQRPYGDPYSVWRDYSNPADVGSETNPMDYIDKEKPRGMGGSGRVNWFKKKRRKK